VLTSLSTEVLNSWFDANTSLILLCALWLLYFCIHSLLANNHVKSRLLTWSLLSEHFYRLFYNSIALVTLVPILIVIMRYQGPSVFQWQGLWYFLALVLNLTALTCFFWSLKYYDMKVFWGWKTSVACSSFVLSPLHRFVRHPWYSCALIILWCRDLNAAQLLSSLLVSVYLVVGSRLEEARLVDEFGRSYEKYMERVPSLIPLPWKFLKKSQRDELISKDYI